MMDTREAVARAICRAGVSEIYSTASGQNNAVQKAWTQFLPEADAAIAAHLKALAASGFVVAPREPTEAIHLTREDQSVLDAALRTSSKIIA